MMDRNILTRAQQILSHAKLESTKQGDQIVIEVASPKSCELYWEQGDGRIIGGVTLSWPGFRGH